MPTKQTSFQSKNSIIPQFYWLLSFILAHLVHSQSLNNDIPAVLYISMPPRFQELIVKENQVLKLPLPDMLYDVFTNTTQRRNSDHTTVLTSYELFPQQFLPSKSCRVVDPDMKIVRICKIDLSAENAFMKDYIFNQETKLVFVRTTERIEALKIVGKKLESRGQTQIPLDMNPVIGAKIKFFNIGEKTYLTNGLSVYKLQLGTNGTGQSTLSISNLTTLKTDKPQIVSSLVKVLFVNNTLLVLGKDFYRLYTYSQTIQDQFSQKDIVHIDGQISSKLTNGYFIDVIWEITDPNNLYILTREDGIIQIRNFNGEKSDYMIKLHSMKDLGKTVSFMRFDNAFEVVFQLDWFSQPYIAQFMFSEVYIQKNGKMEYQNSQFILNRFYDKVSPILDIDYFQGELMVLSQREIHIYGPAVNRRLLLEKHVLESPYIGPNFNTKQFQIITYKDSENSPLQVTKILSLGNDEVSILDLIKTGPSVECRFQKDTHIVVKTLGTCGNLKASLLRDVCVYMELYDIQAINQFSVLQALLFTIGAILVIVCAFCGVNVLICSGSVDIRRKVREWAQRIQAIREKIKRQKIPVNDVDGSTLNVPQKRSEKVDQLSQPQ